jgi:hypothetical protein
MRWEGVSCSQLAHGRDQWSRITRFYKGPWADERPSAFIGGSPWSLVLSLISQHCSWTERLKYAEHGRGLRCEQEWYLCRCEGEAREPPCSICVAYLRIVDCRHIKALTQNQIEGTFSIEVTWPQSWLFSTCYHRDPIARIDRTVTALLRL